MAGPTLTPFFNLTWGDLKNRIVQDLGNRQALLPQADQYARGRVEFFTKSLFYPANQTTYFTTQPGVGAYQFSGLPTQPPGSLPPTEQIEKVRLLLNNTWIPINIIPWRDLLDENPVSPEIQTIPADCALRGNVIRFFPAPAGSWQIELTVGTKIPCPTQDTDSNFWTSEAAELIIAATVEMMASSMINAPDIAMAARQRKMDEMETLTEQSARKRGGMMIKPYYA